MTELEQKIFDAISQNGQYRYSSDMAVKSAEIKAVDSLKSNGYILVKAESIGFVIAETT